jgi:hypothetical protein
MSIKTHKDQMTDEKPNLRTLKALIKLANDNQIETLEFGSIKIIKSKYIIELPEATKKPAPTKEYSNPLYSSQEEQDLWEFNS